MSDRELLEFAAKAAGMPRGEYCEPNHEPSLFHSEYGFWQPLADDGDALRLAVKLGLTLHSFPDHHQGAQSVVTMTRHAVEVREYAENCADDLNAATRRAIVRAAAAIGKEMQ